MRTTEPRLVGPHRSNQTQTLTPMQSSGDHADEPPTTPATQIIPASPAEAAEFDSIEDVLPAAARMVDAYEAGETGDHVTRSQTRAVRGARRNLYEGATCDYRPGGSASASHLQADSKEETQCARGTRGGQQERCSPQHIAFKRCVAERKRGNPKFQVAYEQICDTIGDPWNFPPCISFMRHLLLQPNLTVRQRLVTTTFLYQARCSPADRPARARVVSPGAIPTNAHYPTHFRTACRPGGSTASTMQTRPCETPLHTETSLRC